MTKQNGIERHTGQVVDWLRLRRQLDSDAPTTARRRHGRNRTPTTRPMSAGELARSQKQFKSLGKKIKDTKVLELMHQLSKGQQNQPQE